MKNKSIIRATNILVENTFIPGVLGFKASELEVSFSHRKKKEAVAKINLVTTDSTQFEEVLHQLEENFIEFTTVRHEEGHAEIHFSQFPLTILFLEMNYGEEENTSDDDVDLIP